MEDSNLTDDYMTEIRKSRLLNSQLNVRDPLNEKENLNPRLLLAMFKYRVLLEIKKFTTLTKVVGIVYVFNKGIIP